MWFGLYKKGKCFVVHTRQPTWTIEFCSKIQHTHKASKSFPVTCITSIYIYIYIYITCHFQPQHFPTPPMTLQDTVKAALKVMRSACRSGSRCKFSSCCKAWKMATTVPGNYGWRLPSSKHGDGRNIPIFNRIPTRNNRSIFNRLPWIWESLGENIRESCRKP